MTVTVAVIIPFYQRQPGILRHAIDSVLAQDLPDDVAVKIVVIDDESPLPAREELGDVAFPIPFSLVVLNRPNGGPGGARNTGLDHLDPHETDFVAFLDSDDEWYPGHLRAALAALVDGVDLYFANSMHDGVTSFSYFNYMSSRHDLGVGLEPDTRTIPGTEAFDEFLVHCIPHTSNVVYRFAPHNQLRFDTSLRRTGEDQLFWITLAGRCEKVAYSTAIMGARGRGVSVYRDALAWDSPHAPDRLIDGLVFRDKLLKAFNLTPEQRALSEKEAQETRDHLTFLCLRNLRSQPGTSMRAAVRITRELPRFWLHFPRTCLRLPAHQRSFRSPANTQTVQDAS